MLTGFFSILYQSLNINAYKKTQFRSYTPWQQNRYDIPLLFCPFFSSPHPSLPPPPSSWYVVICRDDDLLISAGGMFDKQAAAGTHSGCNLTCSVISGWLITQRLGLWHYRATGAGWCFHLISFYFIFVRLWTFEMSFHGFSLSLSIRQITKKIQSIPDIRKSLETADDSCLDPHSWQWGKFIEWI